MVRRGRAGTELIVAVALLGVIWHVGEAAAAPGRCDPQDVYDSGCRRVVVGAGEGGFDAGLYYASPGGEARRVSETADPCPDCSWQTTAACDGNRPADPADPGDSGRGGVNCRRASAACPGGLLQQVWLKRPDQPWRPVDVVCIAWDGRISNLRDLAPDVTEAFRHLPLPAPELHLQPASRAIVGIATIFYAAPESNHVTTVRVDGFAVELTATAEQWNWSFDDQGAETTTREPGRPYPDHTVSHVYTKARQLTPGVAVQWRGSYVVAGTATEVAIDERVSRATTTNLTVREAHAQLIAGP